MATATFNGVVIAESDDIEVVEGNLYFPIDSLDQQYITDSDTPPIAPGRATPPTGTSRWATSG